MPDKTYIPSMQIRLEENGKSAKIDERGMREMQARAYKKRGEQYLLIKSPPASGKSRALMFIALDKLHRQALRKAIICVPERSIGGSFSDRALTKHGFDWDWRIAPHWNLCDSEGSDAGCSKVKAVAEFLASDKEEDRILLCTHATFRFAFEQCGAEAFDNCLLAIDEFHHASGDTESSRLGKAVSELMARGKAHITAMTGSYFRGDSVPVLRPEDEEKFVSVTYTYYEQLNGYQWLKELELGYYFYQGRYLDSIMEVLDPQQKTIIHIPNVNARESTSDKLKEAEHIMNALGSWEGADEQTGFQLVRRADGRILRIADLVDDEPKKRERVIKALKDQTQAENRNHVDIIIALGMAKEGFDWIWCEHALTVGYRSSLTEIVQIIGRCTRDAPGKAKARFTNLIAEPDASADNVKEAINDTLKAIAVSLLMEQVLAPKFEFVPKLAAAESAPREGFDYGAEGYQADKPNVGYNEQTGAVQIEINGLVQPKSPEAQRICREDLQELLVSFVQDRQAIERGVFDQENTIAEELTIVRMGKIINDKYPKLSAEDKEAVRQQAIAGINLIQKGKDNAPPQPALALAPAEGISSNTALLEGVRKFITNVRNLNIDLIDSINPFGGAYSILSKAMNGQSLKVIESIIAVKRVKIEPDEAKILAARAVDFKRQRGHLPNRDSADPWENRMALGAAAFIRYKEDGIYKKEERYEQ